MRFIHIADIHLGASPEGGKAYSKYREKEIWDTFSKVVDICEKERIDILLIAGDLFHRQPLLRELKEVDYLFSQLSLTKVVFVVGNHDYLKKNSYYRTYKWGENVVPILSETMDTVEIEDLDLSISGCSYHSVERTENEFEQVPSIGVSKNNILLLHGGDEKHMPFSKEVMKYSDFDYIALGHIHQPKEIIKNKMAYAGCLEPTDSGDVGKRGYIQGEIKEGQTIIRFIPFSKREYSEVSIDITSLETMREIKEELRTACDRLGREHMYIVTLEGVKKEFLHIHTEYLDDIGNVIKIKDKTRSGYDIDALIAGKEGILISEFIKSFGSVDMDSVEHRAMLEGIDSIMRIKRGYE